MDIKDYEREFYENLERGEVRRNGIRRALDTALEKQDWKNAFDLYYEFISEDTFHCDMYQAVIVFPEYLALFENHPEYQDDYCYDVMWAYKWIVGNFVDFYQISMEQINNILSHYESFCEKFGYSKRTYYQNIWNFMEIYFERNYKFRGMDIKEYHNKAVKSRDDILSDCDACELDDEIRYILSVENDVEKALKKAKPILSGKLKCSEVPHVTYKRFAQYYFKNGDLENAKKYIDKAYRLINRDFGNDTSLISPKGICIMIMAYTDVEKALKAFKKAFPMLDSIKNGLDNFDFYCGAYHLMLQLEKKGRKTVRMNFPFKSEPIYNEKGEYSVTELKDFMYSKAKYYADKFDERNGNSKFNNNLNTEYEFDYSKFKPNDELDVPVLDYIRESMSNGALPEDFSLPSKPVNEQGMKFADGAMDGILMYHTGAKSIELSEDIKEIIKQAADGATKKSTAKIEKYFNKTDNRMLSLIDNLQRFILDNTESLDPNNMYKFAIELTVGSKNKEAVKFGLSILELFSEYNDALLQAILDIALCDEFTLYCIWAVRNLENGNNIIFDIAKKTQGWGHIHAVDALKADTDEIKEWLLNYGCINNVLPQYSAAVCFEEAGVEEMLENGLTQEQLTPVGNIISYLINEGPVVGISGFENADEIINNYLNNAEKLECSENDNQIIEDISKHYENDEIKARCDELLKK